MIPTQSFLISRDCWGMAFQFLRFDCKSYPSCKRPLFWLCMEHCRCIEEQASKCHLKQRVAAPGSCIAYHWQFIGVYATSEMGLPAYSPRVRRCYVVRSFTGSSQYVFARDIQDVSQIWMLLSGTLCRSSSERDLPNISLSNTACKMGLPR